MGMFGKKKAEMNPEMAYQMPSIDGSPMAIPQQPMQPQMQPTGNPLGFLGGYDQNAAMQGKSGFAPMNEGMPAKKPGTNWAGIAADFLAGMAGQPGPFAAQQQHERAMQQRMQMAEQQRQQGFQDYVRKAEYDRANPDTPQPTAMERNLAVYSQWTPEQRRLYGEMNPLVQTLSDGSSRAVNRYDMQQTPTFGGWPDEGGQSGKPTGNFRPR